MIYADNAATTKISNSAFEKMLPFLREQYGNASSQYSLGTKAKRAIELARKQVAVAIGARTVRNHVHLRRFGSEQLGATDMSRKLTAMADAHYYLCNRTPFCPECLPCT